MIIGLGDAIKVTLVNPGVVGTDFSGNAKYDGSDSRLTPGAQPVEEVGGSGSSGSKDCSKWECGMQQWYED